MKNRLLSGVALTGLLICIHAPAFADGGAGGTGTSGVGGTAGATSTTGAGTNGGNSGAANTNTVKGGGGGGGGAGATGGAGGRGSDSTSPAGAGGASAGANGGWGTNGSTLGASGGGGGAHGYVGATLPVSTVAGGTGGDGGSSTGGGGGGGAGGYGAVITASSLTGSITNNITGGAAGNGGNGGGVAGNYAGAGGAGGIGLLLTGGFNNLTISSVITGGNGGNAGSSVSAVAGSAGGTGLDLGSANTVTITGSVIGGNGGTGISGGAVGAGGLAIFGSGVNVTIGSTGIVTAGLNGAGVRANAITFTGGGNLLTLQSGYAITGNVVGSGTDTLRLGGTTNGSFDIASTQFSGFTDLRKIDAGTWTLTGTKALTGAIDVSAGTLSVNGSLTTSSSFTLTGTGTLGGIGTVSSVSIASGATLAPGNSIGTLNVTGTVALNSGAHYAVEYDSASADRTTATGAVTVNSGAILDLTGSGVAGDYATARNYTILSGSSVTGTFGTINNSLAFLDASQSITGGNALVLTLTRNQADFSSIAADPAQAQTADAVNALGNTNPIFNAFTSLTTPQAQDALDDLSGEHNAGIGAAITQSIAAIQSVLATHMTGLSHGASVGDVAAIAPAQDPSVYTAAYFEPTGTVANNVTMWMQAIGTIGNSDADNNKGTPKQDRHSYGALAGIDVPLESGGYMGGFAGYERGEVATDSAGAASDLNNYHLGFYATKPVQNGFNISGGIGGTYHDIESVRHVTVGALQFSPHGDTKAWTGNAFAEISKPVAFNALALEPFAGIGMMYAHMDGYTETNGGAANLTVDSSNTFNPSTIIGARTGKQLGKVKISGSLGWQHTFGDIDGKITERFVGGTTSFDAFGAARSRDAAVVGLSADTSFASGMKAYAGYDGTLSADSQDHGFKAGVKIDF